VLILSQSVAQNIPNGGLITFAAIIVSGLGYSKLVTTLLGIPTGVIATLWAWMMAYPAGKLKRGRCLIIATANLVTITCAILMWKLPRSNKHGLLAAYYVFYTYWGPYCLAQTLYMANTSGHSKKVTMGAVYFIGYCVGNVGCLNQIPFRYAVLLMPGTDHRPSGLPYRRCATIYSWVYRPARVLMRCDRGNLAVRTALYD
jgi:hypothetical protein